MKKKYTPLSISMLELECSASLLVASVVEESPVEITGQKIVTRDFSSSEFNHDWEDSSL